MSKASDESKDFMMEVAQGLKERDITRTQGASDIVKRGGRRPLGYEARKASLTRFIEAEKVFKEDGDEAKFLWACHGYVTEGALYR